jgi:hypothetical protein
MVFIVTHEPQVEPSVEARALLRESASELDVDDLLDLACAPKRPRQSARITAYLEALRSRPGEHAQVASCVLLYELVCLGEQRRELELNLLVPVLRERLPSWLPHWQHTSPTSVWPRAVELTTYVQSAVALPPPIPDDDDDIEIDLFDAEEWNELNGLNGLNGGVGSFMEADIDIDEEDNLGPLTQSFVNELADFDPRPPDRLFSSMSPPKLERLVDAGEVCRRHAHQVPAAEQLLMFVDLFVAAHVRSTTFMGKRNPERDERLTQALEAFAQMREPPALGAAWLESGRGWQTADDGAWERIVDVIIDYCAHLSRQTPDAQATPKSWVQGYVRSDASMNIPRRVQALKSLF